MQGKLSYAILNLPQTNKHSRFPFDLGAEFLFKEEKFDPSDLYCLFVTFVVVMSIIPI
nr:MAG TPA: hypothetical protein [Caudoviricetes sp.]